LRRRSRRSAFVADAEATPPPPNFEPARFWEVWLAGKKVDGGGDAYLVVHGYGIKCEGSRAALDVSRCWKFG
jgi:hypothetical protein